MFCVFFFCGFSPHFLMNAAENNDSLHVCHMASEGPDQNHVVVVVHSSVSVCLPRPTFLSSLHQGNLLTKPRCKPFPDATPVSDCAVCPSRFQTGVGNVLSCGNPPSATTPRTCLSAFCRQSQSLPVQIYMPSFLCVSMGIERFPCLLRVCFLPVGSTAATSYSLCMKNDVLRSLTNGQVLGVNVNSEDLSLDSNSPVISCLFLAFQGLSISVPAGPGVTGLLSLSFF